MVVVVALHVAAALLLIVAGLAKIVRPVTAVDLLATLGLPELPVAVVVIGAVESAVGVLALVVGGPLLAAATAALYVGFFAVVWRALVTGATTCGCFGRVNSPPSWLHLFSNAGFAVVSVVAVAGRTPTQVVADQPASGIGFVLAAGVIAGLALVVFTAVPEALAARRGAPSSARFASTARAITDEPNRRQRFEP